MSEFKKVEFRPAVIDDRDFLKEMLITSFFWKEKGRRWLPDAATFEELYPIETLAYTGDFGEDPNDIGVIAETPKEMVGAAWVRDVYRGYPYNGELIPDHSYEVAIAVQYTARRRGIGRRLLGHLSDMATDAGKSYMILGVKEENMPARNLYERSGFEVHRDEAGNEMRVHGSTVPMIKYLIK